MSLIYLPDDILLHITLLLSVEDILSLKQTCRVLHAFGSNEYLWHRLIEHFDLPLNIPQDVVVSDLPAEDLQRMAIQAMRLELNWRRPISRIKRETVVQPRAQELFTHMQFLPGGKWLLTAQRYHRMLMTRSTTRVSVWSLADLDDPHPVFSVDLTGTFRNSALALRKGGRSATLAFGLHEDLRDFIEIHTIPLGETSSSSYAYSTVRPKSPDPVRRLDIPEHIVTGSRVIQDLFLAEGVLATTVAICGHQGGVSFHILLADVNSGLLRWVDPRFSENFGLLQIRIQSGHIFLIGQKHNTTVVHVHKLPRLSGRAGTAASHPHSSSASSRSPELSDLIDLGPVVGVYQHKLPNGMNTMADVLYVPQVFKSSISVMMFNVLGAPSGGHRASPAGYIMIFQLTHPSGETSSTVDISKSFYVPCQDDTSQQQVKIGTTGRRMVWLVNELETGRNRLMKLEVGGYNQRKQEILRGLLLPPEPNLPFSVNACNSLAFDEVTGRLCLAFHDGSLHILDFV